jgi:hypothetical protein
MGKLIKVNCADKETAEAVMKGLMVNEKQITSSVEQFLRQGGYGKTDVTIDFNMSNNTMSVTPSPEDKGLVLSLVKENLHGVDYLGLADKAFYLTVKDSAMLIYQKNISGVDDKIGVINSIKNIKQELKELPEKYAQYLKQQSALAEEVPTATPMSVDQQ